MHQKLKLVARQNRRLRELLRLDYAPDMTAKDFCLLNVAQITELINVRKLEVQQTGATSEEGRNDYSSDTKGFQSDLYFLRNTECRVMNIQNIQHSSFIQ